jgi:hypothetical protein
LLCRSGKFGTPFSRMQRENATAAPVVLEPLPVGGLLVVGGMLRVGAVGLVEAPGRVGEPEPQAAIALAAASAASAGVARRRGLRTVCIRSRCVGFRVVGRDLAAPGER